MSDAPSHEVFIDTSLGTFDVRRLDVTETVHQPTGGHVELRTAQDPGFGGLVDADVVVRIVRRGLAARAFSLRVASVAYLGIRDGAHAYELALHDALWFQRFVTNVRKFRDMSAREIVAQVLGEAGVAHRFELERAPWSRPYTVQYRETNLDFVMRLLEFEGIHRRAEDDGTIVFSDRSSASPSTPALVELLFGGGALSRENEALTRFARGARVGSGAATVNDYNWKTPDRSLLQSRSGAKDTDLEVYDYPVGYRDAGQGATLARLRLEALEAEKRYATGNGDVASFRAGEHFSFAHVDGIAHGGEWFLTEVEHRYEWVGEGLAPKFENRFRATPLATPYRPPLSTPAPAIDGLHTAMVRGPAGEEIHTDEFGRFKGQFHWDREAKGTDKDSRWMRMLQETSSSIVLQRVGWEATVAHIAGDPDRPIGIARKINGQMVPTYAQPANQNVMTIKTETYPHKEGANEIRIDDTAGSQSIQVTAQNRLSSEVHNDQHETIRHDETYTVGKTKLHRVGANQTVTVGNDETIDVGADESLEVDGNRSVTIGAKESLKIKESASVGVHSNDSEKVGSVRTSIVGGIKKPELPKLPGAPSLSDAAGAAKGAATGALQGGQLPSPSSLLPNPQSILGSAKGSLESAVPKNPLDLLQGQINRNSGLVHDLIVGGAHLAVAGGNISNRTSKLFCEVTGGLKLALSSSDSRAESVRGDCTRVTGVAVMENAGTDIVRSSDSSVVTVGAKASISAPDGFDAHGEHVLVEGLQAVVLDAGDLQIELHPDSIRLRGKGKLKAGTEIKVSGGPDNVTE